MREVVIVKALRTAIGSFGGTLKDLTAPQLAAVVIRRILEETNLPPEEIDEVILGNVLQAAAGQNPARQAAMEAGIPETVPAYTINKVCGSGLKAVGLAAQAIRAGDGAEQPEPGAGERRGLGEGEGHRLARAQR